MTTMIDPDWAWSTFEPTDRTWNLRSAAHLHRRAGFGATRTELQETRDAGPQASVDRLLQLTDEPDDFLRQSEQLARAALATGDPRQLSAWWAYRMLSTPAQLLEKLTLFWHGHFATSAEKVDDAELMHTQNQLLRQHAVGCFSDLLLQISRDPAMLIYLDSASNRKAHPNENYAREIMELFCLGEGHYTESDIRELARCFTGWEVRRKKFRFNRYQHDTGEKSILGQTGKFGGEQGVRIVTEQKSAAEFIASRLVRFFVMDEPVADARLVGPLARELRDQDFQVHSTVRRILTSNLFYSEHAFARKVRSPVELAVGFLRSLDGSTNAFELAESVRRIGQGLFYPPSVKGWDGGRTWINSSTLLGRSNLIRRLVANPRTRFQRLAVEDYFPQASVRTTDDLISLLEEVLFAVPVPEAAKQRVRALGGGTLDRDRLIECIHALCTLPEFQLG